MLNNIQLTISYSFEQELSAVRYTLKRYPWFIEQGYPAEIIRLPKSVLPTSTPSEVEMALREEYDEADYRECSDFLLSVWPNVLVGFSEMSAIPSFRLQGGYEVVLTKYGTGGNYNVKESRVTVRIDRSSPQKILGIVVHETVHMTIQYLIERFQVRHWRKERLVDLIVGNYFPGLKKIQNTKEDVAVVDRAFEKHFPDMESVTRIIGDCPDEHSKD